MVAGEDGGRRLFAAGVPDAHEAVRLHLLATGQAVVGRTEVAGRAHLKLTLMNPTATEADVAALVALVARAGAALDRPG
jgi:glutamate/tyrosine decarboxylase-like PLP-dependent enzyme